MYRTLLIAIVLLFSFAAGLDSCMGQKVGDRIVITANYQTKIKAEKVGRVFNGQIGSVVAVNGKWCMIDGVRGWLPLQHTLSLDAALKHYDQRCQANKNDSEAFTTRGMLHYEKGDLKKAFADTNRALQIDDKLFVSWNNRGMIRIAQGDLKKALEDISYAIRLSPEYSAAYANRGLILASFGQFDKAIEDFDNAIKFDSRNAAHYVRRGSAFLDKGETGKALADFDKAIQVNVRVVDAYIGRGNAYLATNKIDEAMKNVNEAIRLAPDTAQAYNLRGWLKYHQGHPKLAVADYDKAIEFDDEMAVAYSNRGVAYADMEDFESAIKDYDKSLTLDGKIALTFSNRGMAWLGKGDYKKAKADFERALARAPELGEALNAYAWFLATCESEKFRDGAKAKELAEKACKLSNEKNWFHLDTLAAACAELGEFDESIKWQKKAIETAPESRKATPQERLELYENSKPYRGKTGQRARQ